MTDKFKNKYRIQSHRMPNWDYSGNGIYFITLVTQNRDCNLGKINKGKMIFSDFGKIVHNEWLKSFEIRNELFLDEYIIMPNHLHAIVVLKKNGNNETKIGESYGACVTNGSDGLHGSHGSGGSGGSHVETHGRASLQSPQPPQSQTGSCKQQFVRKPKSISSFVGGFKSVVNSKIDDYIDKCNLDIPKYNRNNHFFQPNYHDHIIRNNAEYERIKNYIITNPLKWKDDKFNPDKTNKE